MAEWRDIGNNYSCDCGVHRFDEGCPSRYNEKCRAIKGLVVLIWSGEHNAYWRASSCGYTTEEGDAGHYSAEDALARTDQLGPEKEIYIEFNYGSTKFIPPRDDFKRWYEKEYKKTRRVLHPAPPRPDLDALIEKARHHIMTPEEMFEQRVSFVYGNVSMSNPNVTREMVREIALAELPDKAKLTEVVVSDRKV